MNTSSITTEAIKALVDSLESHEGTMTERERQLCTTLLHGLAGGGRLVLEPFRAEMTAGSVPAYNYDHATEAERWIYDQGYEAGWGERVHPGMSVAEIREVALVMIAALERLCREAG